MTEKIKTIWLSCMVSFLLPVASYAQQTALWREGINVIPSPQEALPGNGEYSFDGTVTIKIEGTAGGDESFTARDLAARLNSDFGIEAVVGEGDSPGGIVLLNSGGQSWKTGQGYTLEAGPDGIRIEADGAAGLFYGTRTLLQMVKPGRDGYELRSVSITDKPDIPIRAVHYDTKHHQDRMEYLKDFIRDLADYKINMLIWEWEDKFAYVSHPEIGAPGAFTADEIRELTRYAADYHVQLVPLIQGLGHVSYILKWPRNTHLREIPASNWEFCPLKEGAYELLFDLWREAMEATPGVEYLHIGSDETFELGRGPDCACGEHVDRLGRYSFYMQFVNRCAEYIVSRGRKFIAWTPEYRPEEKIKPLKSGPLMAEYLDLEIARKGLADGYTHWVYTLNPGLEEPFLPYFYRESRHPGTTLENAYETLTTASRSGLYEGMIVASWDASGLHNQVWMMRFVNAAEYAWSGSGPSLEEFIDKYFTNYYGSAAHDVKELFELLNRASYYFMDSFERKVWHWGEIGRTHLPDLPRGDAIEYDPFWNTENAEMVARSRKQLPLMRRAETICRQNIAAGVRHAYDMEVFASIAGLIAHNARTYLALSELENTITRAHKQRFVSHQAVHSALLEAARIVERNLADRKSSFGNLVNVWEKSRVPKGMDTAEKKYFHRQDRGRNFANRRPDMSYLICDEQLLGLEDYLASLRGYADCYARTYLAD
ncbi:MAG: family 20 glycosylhydrolase [Candidatus Glassbacteria bacterium]|nr:family 20 glycosylhydrolase [Candidatus Glassbacteria bacterium]